MGGKQWVKEVRNDWEMLANVALERAQAPARIDARSYEEQGVDKTPQVHLGVQANAMEKRGLTTDRGDLYRERDEMRRLEVNLIQLRQQKAAAQHQLEQQREVQVRAEAQRRETQEQAKREQVQQQFKSEREAHDRRRQGWHKLEAYVQSQRSTGGRLVKLSDGGRVVGRPLGEMRHPKDPTQLIHVMTNAHNSGQLVAFTEVQDVHTHRLWKAGQPLCVESQQGGLKLTSDLRSPLQKRVEEHPDLALVRHREFSGKLLDGVYTSTSDSGLSVTFSVLQDNEKPSRLLLVPNDFNPQASPLWQAGQRVRIFINDDSTTLRVRLEDRSPQQVQTEYKQTRIERAQRREEDIKIKQAAYTAREWTAKYKEEGGRGGHVLTPGRSIEGELAQKVIYTKDGAFNVVERRDKSISLVPRDARLDDLVGKQVKVSLKRDGQTRVEEIDLSKQRDRGPSR